MYIGFRLVVKDVKDLAHEEMKLEYNNSEKQEEPDLKKQKNS